uniref:Probable serine/threonine-protein kinase DDB_G0272282 n=1 Tax=Dermatophagoides pteronyssinus TaxID=6956 RepID=A0A6P6XSR0_DERPT|nr:probable serine/threonine-protein kinase DDB_G0272282 [Dermatophagoides pteronyssinus]
MSSREVIKQQQRQKHQQQDSFVPILLSKSSSLSPANNSISFNHRPQRQKYPLAYIQKRDSSIPNYGYDFFNEMESLTPPGIFSDPNNGPVYQNVPPPPPAPPSSSSNTGMMMTSDTNFVHPNFFDTNFNDHIPIINNGVNGGNDGTGNSGSMINGHHTQNHNHYRHHQQLSSSPSSHQSQHHHQNYHPNQHSNKNSLQPLNPFGLFNVAPAFNQLIHPPPQMQTNRLDLAAGPLYHHGHHHPPVLLVSHKNAGFTNWIVPFLLMLSLPFVSGAAFIPLFLKSIVYLLQIGRNLGIFFPLIPPVLNATHHNHIG